MSVEEIMEPRKPEAVVPAPSASAPTNPPLPVSIRQLLGATPLADWPKIRAFLAESEEELELIELLPLIHRVMMQGPSRLMGRIWKREISVDQPDRAYSRLHDSIHGVRQAALALLELAGFRDFRACEEGPLPGAAPGRDLPIWKARVPELGPRDPAPGPRSPLRNGNV